MTAKKKILLKVSGSIAAFKAAALASKLTQAGYVVRTVLSGGATEFVGVATFEGLTGESVHSSTFAPGDAMAHIDLAKWADLTLVYPASANTLTKFASGRADDLLGTLFLAHGFRTPYWIAPAMNPTMLAHPAVVEAIATLRGWGVTIVDSDAGRMACGDVGYGRLVEPEAMAERIDRYFANPATAGVAGGSRARGRVLVTAGGTSEALDPVRVLTNTSTGETGVRLANEIARQGGVVTLLLSESSPFRSAVASTVRTILFGSFDELDSAMRKELAGTEYGALVHAAAVSDYRVERIENEAGETLSTDVKIGTQSGLVLRLAPNPKILAKAREYAKNRPIRIISFKLATTAAGEKTDLSGYDSDVIVHNRVAEIERGSERHGGEIFERRNGSYVSVANFTTKSELLDRLAPEVLRSTDAPTPRSASIALTGELDQ